MPYGRSASGVPLVLWAHECAGSAPVFIFAGIHGDEAETTIVLSEALRSIPRGRLAADVVLAANPDGLLRGTRANSRGVDLNRNFPTADWDGAGAVYRWASETARDVRLSSGSSSASEPEVQALLKVLATRKPAETVALHAPLGCIDNPGQSPLGRWLADATGLPLVDSVGYATPGSLGTWATENGHSLTTYEFGHQSLGKQSELHYPVLMQVLLGTWQAAAAITE